MGMMHEIGAFRGNNFRLNFQTEAEKLIALNQSSSLVTPAAYGRQY